MSDTERKHRRGIFVASGALIIAAAVAVVVIFFAGGKTGNPGNIEDSRFQLDTIVSIRLYGSDDEEALEGAFELIEKYENILSRHKAGSDVFRINAAAGTGVPVSEETLEVLEAALEYADLSGGAFDPTVGPLVDLWGIGSDDAGVPSAGEIERALDKIDFRKVAVSEGGKTVALEESGMSIDLGAVAKGWIADEVAEYLRGQGNRHILINLGGNILVSGGKPDGSAFRIGMQDPFGETGSYLGIFEVSDASVVSSGVYERYFEEDGVRYHHILSTKDGYPVDSGLAAVTVITESSVDGDALSTSLFALGVEKGGELARNLKDVEAAFITESGEVHMTEGAAEIFVPSDPDLEINVLGER